MTKAPICPVCDQPLDYVPNGMGFVMHGHPSDAGCLFAFEVGRVGKDQAFATFRQVMGEHSHATQAIHGEHP